MNRHAGKQIYTNKYVQTNKQIIQKNKWKNIKMDRQTGKKAFEEASIRANWHMDRQAIGQAGRHLVKQNLGTQAFGQAEIRAGGNLDRQAFGQAGI